MSNATKTRVVVGMSGGVDSSVAAFLLLEQGYDVHGLFMFNWEEDEDGYCTAAQDFQDARAVCAELGIPLHRTDFSTEYRDRVFRYFLDEYAAGRTPNPDVLCNREIKFGAFLEYAGRLGADFIATGHYARLRHAGPRIRLLKGRDADKDQSYFLHAVDAGALARAIFPLGDLDKPDVRRIALEQGFANHAKADSTGICFIGERPFRQFLGRYLPAKPGAIETPDGTTVGTHAGLMYYTLGQRRGLGIGGISAAGEAPWYVADKDLERNVLIVVQGHGHAALRQRMLVAGDLRWIAGAPPSRAFSCRAKTRYRQADQPCQVALMAKGGALVKFDLDQRAVTPGQFVVFYRDEECLGGGVIEHAAATAESSCGEPRQLSA
ncbi:MAG: tRNA 2-thiouridine(34) synthase MnmA [Gammaproteobacteria bacterium]